MIGLCGGEWRGSSFDEKKKREVFFSAGPVFHRLLLCFQSCFLSFFVFSPNELLICSTLLGILVFEFRVIISTMASTSLSALSAYRQVLRATRIAFRGTRYRMSGLIAGIYLYFLARDVLILEIG